MIPLLLFACAGGHKVEPESRTFTILATNDIYRMEGLTDEGLGGVARLRALRTALEAEDPNVLVLHAGDLLSPSLLSRLYKGEQMIDVFNAMDGSETFDERLWMIFGNHEFDESDIDDAAMLDARIDASQFHWLDTNVVFKTNDQGEPLVGGPNQVERAIIEIGGLRVGLFGVTIDSKVPDYALAITDPVEAAGQSCSALRAEGVDVVIGVTHLDMASDLDLLTRLGSDGPDLVIGGHDHTRQSGEVGGRWVYKADADAVTASVLTVGVDPAGLISVAQRYAALGPDAPAPDPTMQARVDGWMSRFNTEYCDSKLSMPPTCLDEAVGRSSVRLVAEETQIRRFETNMADWVADTARAAFPSAQVAFINSGGLRINHDLPANTAITRRHIEELIAYPTPLRLIRIDGATLQKVIERSVQAWTGNGHWLAVSGFAWVHDPIASTAGNLTLLTGATPGRVALADSILAVVPDFLLDVKHGQDGYTMLSADMIVPNQGDAPDLKNLLVDALKQAGDAGISPVVDGRIYNTVAEGPRLALP